MPATVGKMYIVKLEAIRTSIKSASSSGFSSSAGAGVLGGEVSSVESGFPLRLAAFILEALRFVLLGLCWLLLAMMTLETHSRKTA